MANSKRRTRTKRKWTKADEEVRWNSTATQDREWSIARKIKNAVHEQTQHLQARVNDLENEKGHLTARVHNAEKDNTGLRHDSEMYRRLRETSDLHEQAIDRSGLVWNAVSKTYTVLPIPEAEPTKAYLAKTAAERGMLHLEAVTRLARVTMEHDAALIVIKMLAGG